MVGEEENILQQLRAKLDSNRKKKEPEVILFFSYDVVNSSLYKTINYHGWAQVLTNIIKELNNRVKQEIEEVELWRVLGDEAIFIVRIKSEDELIAYVEKIFKILVTTINDMKKAKLSLEKSLFSESEIKLMELQNVLSLKAAAWIALVSEYSNEERFSENIFEKYDIDGKNNFYEFLGNDIDAGFRISKFTADGRLVVSAELAMILATRSNEVKKLNIITYKHLKGIWNNKYYPIIWYHNIESSNQLKLEDTFQFDSEDQEELIKEYYDNRTEKAILRDKDMFNNTLVALNKIKKDRDLEKKIDNIISHIKGMDDAKKDYLQHRNLELHCAAVCYNHKEKAILIVKRSETRQFQPGKWEFGGVKASENEGLKTSVEKNYKKAFDISIEVITDPDREQQREIPLPIALCQIDKDDVHHTGIIVLANIKEEDPNPKITETAKHSDYRWIKENEIDTFSSDVVPDFKSTLRKAFKYFDEMEKR